MVDVISLRKVRLSFRTGSSYHRQLPAASEPTSFPGHLALLRFSPCSLIRQLTHEPTRQCASSFRRSILCPHISSKYDIQTQAVLDSNGQSQKSANFRLGVHTDNYSTSVIGLDLPIPKLSFVGLGGSLSPTHGQSWEPPRHGSLARPGHFRTNLIFVGVRLSRGCEQSAVQIGQNH